MILNNTPQNEAILSNVGEIGEFRIRNSAKAFSILSSGLYANKIRAIIRELSCNAVDSHIAAGKQKTPFDVHLPNNLEPWFAIRDYGTGLDHDQVKNIYTTYFESTKTSSNEFIGALGLGSKSPFSYTDNFTVTAIKDGRKGIYSAFINGEGVPSIALMMEEQTDEPSGVEVKFSVNDSHDFYKFGQEAAEVYTYFALRPVVTGDRYFNFIDITYSDKDIIPGVHYTTRRYSVAVMGNIAYPINVPNSSANLGNLEKLLDCGLELHFGIGELDFQASREGLSYIPQTITAIKNKLEALNAVLASKLAEEADKIENFWDRAFFLDDKKDKSLWYSAVKSYILDTNFPMMKDYGGYIRLSGFKISDQALMKKYNISVRGFTKSRGVVSVTNIGPQRITDHSKKDANGNPVTYQEWEFSVDQGTYFVVNNQKVGALERSKYHWRHFSWSYNSPHHSIVYVLEPFNKGETMKTEQFFKDLLSPKNILMSDALLQKPRASGSMGANVSILRLERKENKHRYRRNDLEMVWRSAGKIEDLDDSHTYYYLPLSGFTPISEFGEISCKTLYTLLKESGVPVFQNIVIYGVRKSDLDEVKTRSNWVNLETFISSQLKSVNDEFMLSLVLGELDQMRYLSYNDNIVKKVKEQNSPYVELVTKFKDVERTRVMKHYLDQLSNRYTPGIQISTNNLKDKCIKECNKVLNRYPLLKYISHAEANEIAVYINMIDSNKGI